MLCNKRDQHEAENHTFTLLREMAVLVEATSSLKNRSEARDTSLLSMRTETQNDLHFPRPSFLFQVIKREAQNRKGKMERTGLAPSPHKSFKI